MSVINDIRIKKDLPSHDCVNTFPCGPQNKNISANVFDPVCFKVHMLYDFP